MAKKESYLLTIAMFASGGTFLWQIICLGESLPEFNPIFLLGSALILAASVNLLDSIS